MPTAIKLKRPLAILDLETTGVAVESDRIIEIAILKIFPDGKKLRLLRRVNPLIPIPPEATDIHGISDADVIDEKSFGKIAEEVFTFLEGCDLGGFNVLGFDLKLLQSEFTRVGFEFSMEGRSVIDAQRIFHTREPRDLSAAAKFYLKIDHDGAHSAMDDVEMTLKVFHGQLERYPDLPREISELHAVCNPQSERYVDSERKFEWRHRKAAFTFGKYKGRLLEEIADESPDYLEWICKGEFAAETKNIVRAALKGKFPKRTVKKNM